MIVRWTAAAESDRADIFRHILAQNPQAAIRMDELFGLAVSRLVDHPRLGKLGRISGTRELTPHESYRIVYEIERETVWILALVHTVRLWPPARL